MALVQSTEHSSITCGASTTILLWHCFLLLLAFFTFGVAVHSSWFLSMFITGQIFLLLKACSFISIEPSHCCCNQQQLIRFFNLITLLCYSIHNLFENLLKKHQHLPSWSEFISHQQKQDLEAADHLLLKAINQQCILRGVCKLQSYLTICLLGLLVLICLWGLLLFTATLACYYDIGLSLLILPWATRAHFAVLAIIAVSVCSLAAWHALFSVLRLQLQLRGVVPLFSLLAALEAAFAAETGLLNSLG